MAAQWTLQDANNHFSAVLEAALAGEPQKVTRRGRWVGVVLSAEEYERRRQLDAGVVAWIAEQRQEGCVVKGHF
jgi:prevent-host-death family protein